MSRRTIALVVLVAAGLGMLLYPTASNWFAVRSQASELTGYSQAIDTLPTAAQQQMLADAEAYNAALATGTVGRDEATDDAYRSNLAPQPGDVMAEVTIPSLGITLPIYHGTSDATLARGVGHLYGTALPVGGVGTHAVLSGHSGLVNAELFTHLEDLKIGDLFSVDVVGRRLVYQVDHIAAVDPHDDRLIQPDPTQDYVTLLTCTPTGVNSYRLLVRGHRVLPVSTSQEQQVIAGRDVHAGFPWWGVEFGGAVAAAFVLGRWLDRGPRREVSAAPPRVGAHHVR